MFKSHQTQEHPFYVNLRCAQSIRDASNHGALKESHKNQNMLFISAETQKKMFLVLFYRFKLQKDVMVGHK